MNDWISVKERLPKVEVKVIVWNTEWPDIEFMKMGYYDPTAGTETGWRCGEYVNLDVTHWMALPEPPKQQE